MKKKLSIYRFSPLLIAISFLVTQSLTARADNLLTANPGFEEDGAHWGKMDGNYWRISENAAPWMNGGDKALQRIAYGGSKKDMIWTRLNDQKIPVKAGAEYQLSAAVAGVGGGSGAWTLCPVLVVLDAQGRELATLEGQKVSRGDGGGYKKSSARLTLPAGAAKAQVGVRVIIDEDLTDIGYLYFDTLSLTEVAEPGAS